jgi:hypothetical protein
VWWVYIKKGRKEGEKIVGLSFFLPQLFIVLPFLRGGREGREDHEKRKKGRRRKEP